jgi:hypothetical protein
MLMQQASPNGIFTWIREPCCRSHFASTLARISRGVVMGAEIWMSEINDECIHHHVNSKHNAFRRLHQSFVLPESKRGGANARSYHIFGKLAVKPLVCDSRNEC